MTISKPVNGWRTKLKTVYQFAQLVAIFRLLYDMDGVPKLDCKKKKTFAKRENRQSYSSRPIIYSANPKSREIIEMKSLKFPVTRVVDNLELLTYQQEKNRQKTRASEKYGSC